MLNPQTSTDLSQRPLGKTGLRLSVLGFGGASIGFSEGAREDFVALIRRARELGINFFDTAPEYRRSEEIIGEAVRDFRNEIFIATKVGRVQSWNGARWESYEDWSEEGVLRTIDLSLTRLQSDYIDLVQLHSPPMEALDDGAALRGLLRAKKTKKVRHIGISADGEVARRAIELGVFETLQISYSILQQESGKEILPDAAARGMGVIIKQPIANGIPAMRVRPQHPEWAWKWDIAQQLDWGALSGDTNRLELALRWVLSNPLVNTAIVGTARLDHLERNIAAALAPLLDDATRQRVQAAYEAARAP